MHGLPNLKTMSLIFTNFQSGCMWPFLITDRSTRARYIQDVKYTHVVLFLRGSVPDPSASAILQRVDIYVTG